MSVVVLIFPHKLKYQRYYIKEIAQSSANFGQAYVSESLKGALDAKICAWDIVLTGAMQQA